MPISTSTMQPLILSHYTMVNALGRGLAPTVSALRAKKSGLRQCDFMDVALDTYIGRVDGLEEESLISGLEDFDCRNNRLAQLGLVSDGFDTAVAAACNRYGAHR
ncbi:MAG: beta-ketoacyl-[acyl-carrier-protein] synthase II, partial [Ferrovum sp.]|nr:beta-ketoacyl-[acyl-carrier-protein] synthase II [Ferrovum sp.]